MITETQPTAMINSGLPKEIGWYWVNRVGNKYTPHGRLDIVEVKCTRHGVFWCDGFSDSELDEVGYRWQPVKPPDFVFTPSAQEEKKPEPALGLLASMQRVAQEVASWSAEKRELVEQLCPQLCARSKPTEDRSQAAALKQRVDELTTQLDALRERVDLLS